MLSDKAAEELYKRMSKNVSQQESIDFMLYLTEKIKQELAKVEKWKV